MKLLNSIGKRLGNFQQYTFFGRLLLGDINCIIDTKLNSGISCYYNSMSLINNSINLYKGPCWQQTSLYFSCKRYDMSVYIDVIESTHIFWKKYYSISYMEERNIHILYVFLTFTISLRNSLAVELICAYLACTV